MRLRSMLSAAALLSSILAMPRSSAAQYGCEDCAIFNADANFSNGGTITGQLFFSPLTDTFIGDQLTAVGFDSTPNGLFTTISSQGLDAGGDYFVDINGPSTLQPSTLELILPATNPAGYSGALCSLATACSAGSTNYDGIFTTSGTLDAVGPTPEPSAFLLLATGLLGIGALSRRTLAANFGRVSHRAN